MPIIGGGKPQTDGLKDRTLIERINIDRVVPVISDQAVLGLSPNDYDKMVEGYACEVVGYPLPDRTNLERAAKYHQLVGRLSDMDLKSDYLNWTKNFVYRQRQTQGADSKLLADAAAEMDNLSVSDFARRLGYPAFEGGPSDPLLVLADLPLSFYVTTSPYTFLEEALGKAGKEPQTELCRWKSDLDAIPRLAGNDPSVTRPWVYHLHGLDRHPDSLVLTEDDHLEFIVNTCQGRGSEAADRIPGKVRTALGQHLMLLGFSLSGWAFRGLYAGIIKQLPRHEDRGVCALQLTPNEHEKQYLEDYVRREAHFDVFWGDLPQYATRLHGLLGGKS